MSTQTDTQTDRAMHVPAVVPLADLERLGRYRVILDTLTADAVMDLSSFEPAWAASGVALAQRVPQR